MVPPNIKFYMNRQSILQLIYFSIYLDLGIFLEFT